MARYRVGLGEAARLNALLQTVGDLGTSVFSDAALGSVTDRYAI